MSELTTTWSGELPLHPGLQAAAHRGATLLKEIVEPNDNLDVASHWSTTRDAAGNLLLLVRLTDVYATATAVFRPDDLAGQNAWFYLSRVYRELLRERVRVTTTKLADPAPAQAG